MKILKMMINLSLTSLMELLPKGPMTRDNVWSMQVPSVCPAGCTLPFGLKATTLEAIAPGYLA